MSVVISSHNEGENLRQTVHSLLAGLPSNGEIIVVDDQSTDGSADSLFEGYGGVTVLRPTTRMGVVGARNLGAAHAHGDVLIFSDAHVTVPLDWSRPLLDVLGQPGVGAVGPVISVMGDPSSRGYGFRWSDAALNVEWLGWQADDPHPVPLLGGGFLAMRREVFDAVGGFDPGFVLWGSEDGELCLRLWSLGYECWLAPSLDVAHLFRAAHPYTVGWEAPLHNLLRTAVIHFGPARMQRLVACLAGLSAFPSAFARLASSDAWVRRAEMHAARRFDDDWFCQRFGLDC